MQFEWDEKKNNENIKKHGISFLRAAQIFFDPKMIDMPDITHSNESEERWNGIGMCGRVLFVVYTERNNKIRIISARKANEKERIEYYRTYDLR